MTYSGSLGGLSNSGYYNQALKEFAVNTSDRDMIAQSPITYSVSSELTQFPGYGTHECFGQVIIADPCIDPIGINVGVPSNADSDYSVAATFTFPTWTVNPLICVS